MNGYEALRERAAWLDVSARGKIRLTGEDRARLLHAMTTNEVQRLKPGDGCYAFFLNAQGRILGDVNILCRPDHFLLDTEPETRAKLYAHLDQFIIADDVTLEDITDQTATIAVEGPLAEDILRKMGAAAPERYCGNAEWGSRLVARIDLTGSTGFMIIAPVDERADVISAIAAADAEPANEEAFRTVRLEHGKPRYGEDISERYLTQESNQMQAVSFGKGCYLGQEIVERVRSRAQIHRRLLPLRVDSSVPPSPGLRFQANGKDAAEITSAAYSPALGCSAALAYVRTDYKPGDILSANDVSATVLASPQAPSPESESCH
jgi:tRNA-modifying protein YgfZ